MIKLMFCVKRKPELSIPEFRRHWQEHQDCTRELARALNAVRITHSVTLAIEENVRFVLTRGTAEPFDGVLEVWWKDSSDFTAGMADKRLQEMIQTMRTHQREFADLPSSMMFFVSEESVQEIEG
jgi:hypothetical protein